MCTLSKYPLPELLSSKDRGINVMTISKAITLKDATLNKYFLH